MTLVVDRTTCTGKGVCVYLLDGALTRDEWGYPIVVDPTPHPVAVSVAISLCPVGALHWLRPARAPNETQQRKNETQERK